MGILITLPIRQARKKAMAASGERPSRAKETAARLKKSITNNRGSNRNRRSHGPRKIMGGGGCLQLLSPESEPAGSTTAIVPLFPS
jgi:hypothetical protein